MRTIRVTGPNSSSSIKIALLSSTDMQSTTVDDLTLLTRIARLSRSAPMVDIANWFTADGYNLISADGYSFNVRG